MNREPGTSFAGREPGECHESRPVPRARQRRAIAFPQSRLRSTGRDPITSQSTDNPVLWRRLELLGDSETCADCRDLGKRFVVRRMGHEAACTQAWDTSRPARSRASFAVSEAQVPGSPLPTGLTPSVTRLIGRSVTVSRRNFTSIRRPQEVTSGASPARHRSGAGRRPPVAPASAGRRRRVAWLDVVPEKRTGVPEGRRKRCSTVSYSASWGRWSHPPGGTPHNWPRRVCALSLCVGLVRRGSSL